MSTVLQYQCSNDGLLRYFHDGQFCKEHNLFSNPQNLQLLLYVDKCEVANPLGSKQVSIKLEWSTAQYCTYPQNIVHRCAIAFLLPCSMQET